MVLEYEQREAAHRAVAHSTYSTTAGEPSVARRRRRSESSRRLPRRPRPGLLARRPRTAPWRPVLAPREAGREQLVRSVSMGTVRRATPAPSPTTRSFASRRWLPSAGKAPLAAKGGKGGGKGGAKATAKPKPKAKPKAAAKSTAKPPGTICPFFQKTGSCRKGANCDMVHSLLAGQGQALPANWGPPSGASMSNPFAAFSIQIGSAGVQAGLPAADPKGAVPSLSRRARAAVSRRSTSCQWSACLTARPSSESGL